MCRIVAFRHTPHIISLEAIEPPIIHCTVYKVNLACNRTIRHRAKCISQAGIGPTTRSRKPCRSSICIHNEIFRVLLIEYTIDPAVTRSPPKECSHTMLMNCICQPQRIGGSIWKLFWI